MKISDYPKFESALSQGRPIIFLCGAGLSVSLGDHAKGWVGWLKEGKAYLSDVEAEELDRRFGSYSASELIDAASFLIEALRKNGNYTAYMDSTIGSLRVQNKKLANALALFVRCGDYFATTNYDKLLEEVTGLGYYTYNMPGKIVQMLSGQAEMSVIHLHGIYDAATNTDDIVADQKQYEDVITNQGAQFIQNLISTCTLVILGCGATVDDPNLKGFMSFASKQLHLNIPYFYLHKAGDDLSDLGPNVIPVCYGMAVPFFPVIKSVLNNSWFCSICCSIIAVYLIYKWQVWYSKRKLKADFRCNEVIEGVYDGIEEFVKFYQEIPKKEQSDGCKTDEDYHLLRKKNAQVLVDFYSKYKGEVFVANLAMAYDGNDLLLDSIQSCFFINLNFELLSIVNHVKNRLPNLRKKYPEIEEIFTRYEKNQNEEDLIKLGNILPTYFMDLKFMAVYWKALFDYLGYDPTFIKLFVDTYNSKYPIEQDMKLPVEVRNTQAKEVEKLVRKAMRANQWKNFWMK